MPAMDHTTTRATDPMADQATPDPQFNAITARLLRREALRRAAEEMSTMTGPGLENALAQISTEVTEEAVYQRATAARRRDHGP
jgi:phage shock protein A